METERLRKLQELDDAAAVPPLLDIADPLLAAAHGLGQLPLRGAMSEKMLLRF